MMTKHSWPLLFVALSSITTAAASESTTSNCYYPDGSRTTDYDYQPCGNSNYATCCYFGEGDRCLPNGLCSNPGQYDYYRAACANKDWSNCPHACMDEDPNNWLGLTKCGENKYCCPSGGAECCTNGAKVYTLEVSNSTDTNSGNSTQTDPDSSSSSGQPTNTQTSSSNSSSKSSRVPVGPIVGGVVGGVFFIGFVIFGFVFFRRRGKKPASLLLPPAQAPPPPPPAASVKAGTSGSSRAVNPFGTDKFEPTVLTSLAEVEGSHSEVWNETDGTPVVGGVRHNYQEEEQNTTQRGSSLTAAEIDGKAVKNSNQRGTLGLDSTTTTSELENSETVIRPHLGVVVEVEGDVVTGAQVKTTNAPLNQYPAEMDAKEEIRPDSSTLVPSHRAVPEADSTCAVEPPLGHQEPAKK
ncbi:hypothetical protein BGZ63DRAFT_175255 [Mariannaea sp. PMI_226]|nr:hypothetical protein BGZ63DRAFT_175255 [Mariannaea sp. PMI_226]